VTAAHEAGNLAGPEAVANWHVGEVCRGPCAGASVPAGHCQCASAALSERGHNFKLNLKAGTEGPRARARSCGARGS
jgi:hypothetical protein